MKILLINYKYYIAAGTERYLFNIKKVFEKNGHTVIPFSLKSSKNDLSPYNKYFAESIGGQDEFLFKNYKITPKLLIDAFFRLFYSFHVKNRLEKLINKTKPDIAYIIHHYNKMSPSVIDACKRYNIPVVQRLSDFFLICPQAHFLRTGGVCEECLYSGYFSAVKYKCVKNSILASFLKSSAIFFQRKILKIYDKVDKYVCTTHFMKQKMIKGGFKEDKLVVIPTFVPDNMIKNIPDDINSKKYILFFGRFTLEKGVDLLIRAYSKTELCRYGVRLVLIGGNPSFFDQFRFSDKELSVLKDFVDVYDFIPFKELEKYIENCLFVVNPTRWYENLPNTILESYSKLKPVISANIGSIPEIVIDNYTGILYRYDDENDLSKKMLMLYLNPDLVTMFKRNIAEKLKTLNKEIHYRNLIKIFETLIKKN